MQGFNLANSQEDSSRTGGHGGTKGHGKRGYPLASSVGAIQPYENVTYFGF